MIGCRMPGKIADGVLDADPGSGGARAGEHLRDRIELIDSDAVAAPAMHSNSPTVSVLWLSAMPRMEAPQNQLARNQHRSGASRPRIGPNVSSGRKYGPAPARGRLRRIAERREQRHFAGSKAALLDQVERQPGEQEIEAVIAAGMADPHRPQRPLAEQPAHWHHRAPACRHGLQEARRRPAARAPARSASPARRR